MNQSDIRNYGKKYAVRKILNALKLCIMDRKVISHKAPLYQGNRLFSKSFKKPYVKKRFSCMSIQKRRNVHLFLEL